MSARWHGGTSDARGVGSQGRHAGKDKLRNWGCIESTTAANIWICEVTGPRRSRKLHG